MSFSKVSAFVLGIVFILILYFIIYYALKIMYKDVKGGGKKKRVSRKSYGLEIIAAEELDNIKVGTVIPVRSTITIGRKDDNSLVLDDQHVSGHHANLTIKNEVLYLEDLNSTNGTFVNGEKIKNSVKLFKNDQIEIGTTKFKVL